MMELSDGGHSTLTDLEERTSSVKEKSSGAVMVSMMTTAVELLALQFARQSVKLAVL